MSVNQKGVFCSKAKDAELVTGDREFKTVEKDLKKIRWLK